MSTPISDTPEWKALVDEAAALSSTHLRELIRAGGDARAAALSLDAAGVLLDVSRQRVTPGTMAKLRALALAAGLPAKIGALASGAPRLNGTEGRAVLHMALRAPAGAPPLVVDGADVRADVAGVRARIAAFAQRVRAGAHRGATGRPLTDVLSIGIGGSYLGVEFVHEALRCDAAGAAAAAGRRLRFLANVDPVDFARAVEGLDPETTLVLVVSKTFTTAETMLNARTARDWLVRGLAGKAAPAAVVAAHVAAVSTALPLVAAFGIAPDNVFGFWDWVGGRYSVTSAVGVLPLSLVYGPAVVDDFLAGAAELDEHFTTAPLEANLPVTLGLLGVWNATFLGHATRALLPYSQALLRLPAHIQQVSMESNGKRVDVEGRPLPFAAGAVEFGEPGTNGQHSFYQLLHQGRVVPADFVGFATSQAPVALPGEAVSNHDELMSNFFAQPDALALGKTAEEVAAEGTPAALVPHKVFPGDRPSSSLLLRALDARAVGRLLALFEHRTAVEGFVWGICSFDQWGVELGKKLANNVRGALKAARAGAPPAPGAFTPSTHRLLAHYLAASAGEAAPPAAAQ